jgi:Xaa-Pro aminopeptidase
MFQSFDVTSRPEQGPPRLEALRAEITSEALGGFLVPRADMHQGEYVAPHDERLSWLTGFTGSAGFCAVLPDIAGVFIDGRYRLQIKDQIALRAYTPVHWPETSLGDWLKQNASQNAVIGFDPWLHSQREIMKLNAALEGSGVTLRPCENLIDRVWTNQPDAPKGAVRIQPDSLTGRSAAEKRRNLARELRDAGHKGAVLTLPDSISWLLNMRGADIARNPVVHALAVLHADEAVDLYIDADKLNDAVRSHLSEEVTLHAPEDFLPAIIALEGPLRVDPDSAPVAVFTALGDRSVEGQDPCIMPKAVKTPAEVQATREAHLRDGAAMVRFLAWLEGERSALLLGNGEPLTEIDVVTALEGFRRATNHLEDISFETIAGTGPHGAIVHYRVSTETNRAVQSGDLLLVDSGGQYADGTTDITRTIAMGEPPLEAQQAFTRVLQGMIAISRARWPKGLTGRDLDPLARAPLWMAGQDYDHGTGHGVGAFLSVHEGPQRISRASDVALEPGMILSNEPGYYREGAFGIRIENLVVVREATPLKGADDRAMLMFETLTWAPIDSRLILADRLSGDERHWLNSYHQDVAVRLGPWLDPGARAWLAKATAPL